MLPIIRSGFPLLKMLVLALILTAPGTAFSRTQQRLISLKPNITRSLIAMGLKDQIVGITKFCDRPNPTAQVVGDYNSFDVEKIVRLKPDLVITSRENASTREFAKLDSLKIPTLLLSFDTWREMLLSLDQLEQKLKSSPTAPGTAKPTLSISLARDIMELKSKTAPLSGKNFVVIVQRTPLMVAGGKSFISTLFSEIGLTNLFQNNAVAWPTIDEEIFIREGPELVFELSHETIPEPEFLGQKVIPLKMEAYLAAPQAVDALQGLIQTLLPP